MTDNVDPWLWRRALYFPDSEPDVGTSLALTTIEPQSPVWYIPFAAWPLLIPANLLGQSLNLVAVGIRPQRARPCCMRAGGAASTGSAHDRLSSGRAVGRTDQEGRERVAHRDNNPPCRVGTCHRQLPNPRGHAPPRPRPERFSRGPPRPSRVPNRSWRLVPPQRRHRRCE